MWKKINFNKQNIKAETANSVLIQIPNNSDSEFAGWMFWHPAKLVRVAGGQGYWVSFSYTNEWEFKIFKGKGQYHIEETLTAENIEEIFGTGNDSIETYVVKDNESFLEISEPEEIRTEVIIHDDLKR
ncbi:MULTISPECIES: hypothetical protein [unclassified Facklamia]|uniref:hypothetical protein n=1 Tax=Aerococcaceae TaxID=186827 RepID=UPI0013BC531F|nr:MULTISPECIES: hypothetical protein [unclassified Facklamia]NEW65318.1 hypothetical protein [Facklamia sp. 252]NEW68338.1 hypothetical protein [Facklamia sp. 253]QQD66158.1 hypothetical protein JDW14_03370 [Aerococcaceae bacterium zg-252]